MKRFKSDINDLLDMNLTKAAAAKRARCTPKTLDKECIKEFGKNWTELKAKQRQSKNEALRDKVTGEFYYAYSYRMLRM